MSLVMQRLSYQTYTVSSNKITRNPIIQRQSQKTIRTATYVLLTNVNNGAPSKDDCTVSRTPNNLPLGSGMCGWLIKRSVQVPSTENMTIWQPCVTIMPSTDDKHH